MSFCLLNYKLTSNNILAGVAARSCQQRLPQPLEKGWSLSMELGWHMALGAGFPSVKSRRTYDYRESLHCSRKKHGVSVWNSSCTFGLAT